MNICQLRFDQDHAEHLMRAFYSVTVDPVIDLFFYAFPFCRAMGSWPIEIRENDPSQNFMMPESRKSFILNEIKDLTHHAGITRSIRVYATLNHHFDGYGGKCSFTSPCLFLPYHHLFPKENQPDPLWDFSANETRFLICRELAQIQRNDLVLRIAIKVCLFIAGFTLYATPLAWIATLVVLAAAVSLHLLSERYFESKMDAAAIPILGKRLGDTSLAKQVALDTLQKMAAQNIERRKLNPLCRLYTTGKGNNLLDLTHPFLTTRIRRTTAAMP